MKFGYAKKPANSAGPGGSESAIAPPNVITKINNPKESNPEDLKSSIP